MMYHEHLAMAIKVNGKILREKGDTVYLPWGCEYSIVLKNLSETKKCQVSVNIDGKEILEDRSIIVNPNSTTEVERWIVNGNLNIGPKLKFIRKTSEIEEVRGNRVDDGIIKVGYCFEKRIAIPIITSAQTIHHHHHYSHMYYPPSQPIWGSGYDNTLYGSSFTANTRAAATKGSSAVSAQSAVASVNHCGVGECTMDWIADETGITIKGQDSNQHFKESNENLKWEDFRYDMCLKLCGKVENEIITKPILTKTKLICGECHSKNSSNNSYCSKCGNSLKIY